MLVALIGLVGDAPAHTAAPLPRVGTITMGVWRPTFVVLGADRLAYQRDSAGGIANRKTHSKFAVHPTLPLGVVHSGLGSVPPGPRDTNEAVREALERIQSQQLTRADLVTAFVGALEGPVRQARADIRKILAGSTPSVPKEILDESHLTLLVGFVANGSAVLLTIEIRDSSTDTQANHFGAPQTLAPFYSSGKYQADADLFGAGITGADALAGHVRTVIVDGIREDARLNKGQNNVVGGGIDIVVVDATGARLRRP
jgi:hypothetical protein